ncbi:deoxyribonuclease IV [Actinocatenispora rupis]|nr:deoxyribonuclease IV [Actinocatenispora rupis]
MRIGAHVESDDPLAAAKAVGADAVQFFLSDPQAWETPQPHPRAAELRAAADAGEIELYVHAPYRINLASTNNRLRIPSRKLLAEHAEAAAAIGAKGLIVHGGHVTAKDDIQVGFDNWRKAFQGAAKTGGYPLPILIENTAGGDHACARRFENLARLWDAIGEFEPGFCLDTCHAYCGGEDLTGIVDRLRGITGRVDLVHANGTNDGFDSGRDRHANITDSALDPELVVHVIGSSGATAVVENPNGAAAVTADVAYLRERLAS